MLKNKGFTLIELLIVIAIVAVLAGAMVPVFRVTRLEAQQARVQADLDTIKTAALMLHHDTGVWPVGGTLAVPRRDGAGLVTNSDGTTTIPNWRGPYMDEWRADPWTFTYGIYNVVVGTATTCRVLSYGADNAQGGAAGTANADITLLITPDRSF